MCIIIVETKNTDLGTVKNKEPNNNNNDKVI